MSISPQYPNPSYWFASSFPELIPRPPLTEDIHCDVAIVGGGFSGLWTAYYLKRAAPRLKVVLVEGETAGFGASGRNGGWLMGSFLGEGHYLKGLPAEQASRVRQLIRATVDEVKQVIDREGIDCDFAKGGSLYAAARYPQQLQLLEEHYRALLAEGNSEADYRWLNRQQLHEQLRLREGQAAIFSPHCAAIHPAKLIRALADVVEKQGVSIFEQSPVQEIRQGRVICPQGSVRADIIVSALEGYGARVKGCLPGRRTLPIQSLVVATEVLSDELWQEIGLQQRQVFADSSRLITYGQRSADGRMIFGARGDYAFGGAVKNDFSHAQKAFAMRENVLRDLFPCLDKTAIEYRWGGTMGMVRDYRPFALYDQAAGFGCLGGYGGEGVGAANLFARTLVDLLLEKNDALAAMPWAFKQTVPQVVRPWEPEPLRWLTYQLVAKCLQWEEAVCASPSSPSWLKASSKVLADSCATFMPK